MACDSCQIFCFFFFQAEDGIRDATVTGFQTCSLPICGTRLLLKEAEFHVFDIIPHYTPEKYIQEIGRAAWRERGENSGGARSLKKKKNSASRAVGLARTRPTQRPAAGAPRAQ